LLQWQCNFNDDIICSGDEDDDDDFGGCVDGNLQCCVLTMHPALWSE
jgi:hypothetical protein